MTYIANEEKLLDYKEDSNDEFSDDEEDGPNIFKKEDFENVNSKKINAIKQVANEIITYINKIRSGYKKELESEDESDIYEQVAIDYIERVEERIILTGICYKYLIKLIKGDNPEKLQFVAKKTGVKTGKTAIQLVSMPEPISIFPNQFLDKIKKKREKNLS